ncbi:MAG: hypothetical protein JWM56_1345 [Candidatus Peribacteria bacterium]|nr:hypothetical protein [Candidatus Peribacteria bacterium]
MSRYKQFLTGSCGLFLLWAVFSQGIGGVVGLPHVMATALDTSSVINTMRSFVDIILMVLNVGMWIIFRMLDVVMDPAVIFDLPPEGSGQLYNMLHFVWQFSRDLVNVSFAFMLIVGALYVIVRSDSNFIKERAPKFVLAIVLVNFSWFVPQVIYDVSQITAYTVYQIPSLIPGGANCRVRKEVPLPGFDLDDPKNFEPCRIVTNVLLLDNVRGRNAAMLKAEDEAKPSPIKGEWECVIGDQVCIRTQAWNDPSVVASADSRIINGLIINHARMRLLLRTTEAPGGVPGNKVNQTTRIITELIKIILVLVMHVALFFPMLALLVAFLIRIPILWITMCFMPFVFVEFVYGSALPGGINLKDKIWKNFLTAVFLPTAVAVPFAIGFILINVGNTIAPPMTMQNKLNDVIPLFAGIQGFWPLLWMMIALAILWTGVFAALKTNEYVGGITERIKSTGQATGKLVATAPLALPIVPLPSGKRSPLDLLRSYNPNNLLRSLEQTGRLDPGYARNLPNPAKVNAVADHITQDQRGVKNAVINLKTIVNSTTSTANQKDAEIRALRAQHSTLFHDGNATAAAGIQKALGLQEVDRRHILEALNDEEERRTSAATPPPVAPPATPPTPPPVTPPTT